LASRSIKETVSEVEPSEAESGAVQRAVRGSTQTAKNTAKIARRLYVGSKAKQRISNPEEGGMRAGSGIAYRHREYVSQKGLGGLSYGDPDTKKEFKNVGGDVSMHRTGRMIPHHGMENQRKRAAVNAQKTAARTGAAKQGSKTAGAAAKKGIASIENSLAGGFKWLLPFSLPMVAIVLVVIIVMGAVISIISPLGFFFSDNKADKTYSVNNIILRVNQSWYDELASKRKHYEDMGYIVNVSYNVGEGDGVESVNNWQDVLALYIVGNTTKNKNMVELNASDEFRITSLFFEMNPINVSTRVDQVEKDSQNEDVDYADISVSNLRYVQMLSKYPLDSFQTDMIKFMMSPDMGSTWTDMGIDYGSGTNSNVDVNSIIQNLPAGSPGSKIMQAAFIRLGDPYSMELRGQANFLDCSYLTQWAYAQAGISIPGTAAEQAQYCVQTGKVVAAYALQPGDLIFWSYPNNPRVAGRFMDIGHVAIYVKNGIMIEAAPSAGCVTYRAVSVQGQPVLYARPYV
jgi:cell wall-associated NlpC family hydrolase